MRADHEAVGTAFTSDPVLKAIDPEIMPLAYQRLPDDEQMWRGRLFMAIYWMSHDLPYSWSGAMVTDPEFLGDWRTIIEQTPDELLLARYRAAGAEIAVETGQGLGPTQ